MQRILTSETVGKIGETVTVAGWIHARRDMGKVAFFDLRDKEGLIQVVAVPAELGDSAEISTKLRSEWVVAITGIVQARGAKQVNDKLKTGTVELLAKSIVVLNEAKTPPFEIDKDTRPVNEEARLTYRYLDLRSERMQKNLRTRHAVFQDMRHYFNEKGFIEVETPILTKGTPEGAREFIVPSRPHPGNFYVLPQSPQQFKQLLMVAGVERYYQLAKCFRDEDQRGDRQPEFTQLDLEMSFVEREDVMGMIEELLIQLVKTHRPDAKIQQLPFPRMTYKESMEKYGNDRPDIREDKNDPNLFAFCWVIDFPFFEKTEDGGWTFTHNPFSAALPEWREKLANKEDIGNIITSQYDIVLNGFEIGGGSIRNHQPEMLRRVFEIMGFPAETIDSQFGHMMKAFELGAPPHGGIALGVDRVMALFQGEANIREVMAFPKDGNARDHMMGAPSPLPEKALKEANIKLS
ncbi:MAG: aspartate--tRNA ligase [Patescibacteria group bacterium]|jgi:aspartyl-tRNA synthetase